MKISGMILISALGISNLSAQNAEYYRKLAADAESGRKTLEAIQNLQKSLAANPNYVPALIDLGRILRSSGDLNLSLTYLRKAVKLAPDNLNGTLELAETLIAADQDREAARLTNEVLSRSPRNADFNYIQAKLYLRSGKEVLAEQKLRSLLQSHPDHFRGHLTLGYILLRQRQYTAAEKSFYQARLIRPESAEVFLSLADIRVRQITDRRADLLFDSAPDPGMFQEAVDFYLNAIAYNDQFPEANMSLGRIYALTGRCETAIPYFETVIGINPGHFEANYYIGYCDRSRALKLYPEMLRSFANDELLRYRNERNRIKTIKKRENPLIASAAEEHYIQGQSLMRMNRLDDALFEFRYALDLYPSYLKPREELLQLYRSERDVEGVQSQLDILRRLTDQQKFQDMYEQYVELRKSGIAYRERIPDVKNYRNGTPVFVFHFRPENPLGKYPDAGEAISDLLTFALKDKGRLVVVDNSQRDSFFSSIRSFPYFGNGGHYSATAASLLRSSFDSARKMTGIPFERQPILFAIDGSYIEIAGGLRLNMQMKDLRTNHVIHQASYQATGRGYLRSLSLQMATEIYRNIPWYGNIIRISGGDVILNIGNREGITTGSILDVYRNRQKITEVKISRSEDLLSTAQPGSADDTYLLQPGDIVILRKPTNSNR